MSSGAQPTTTALADDTAAILRDSAADFCTRALPPARLRELRGQVPCFDRARWREMCELGWPAILAPESLGGLGLSAAELGVVCRQIGRVAAPEPVLETAATAIIVLAHANTAYTQELLQAALAGDLVTTVAMPPLTTAEEAAAPSLQCAQVDHGLRLDGSAGLAPLATAADGFVVAAQLDEQLALLFVPRRAAGLSIRPRDLADGSQDGELAFVACECPEHALLATGTGASVALTRARNTVQLLAAAYVLGLGEALFDTTIEYLKTRQQFGRAIGGFQALQHRAVDLFIQKSMASAVVEESLHVFAQAQSEPERALAASRAKYRATEATLQIARQAVQLHGAIGFTDECDVGLYLNRALVVAARYGNASWHCQRLAALDAAATSEGDGHGLGSVYSGEGSPEGGWSSLGDENFRATVRNWFEANYPAEIQFFPRRLRWQEIKPWYLQLAAKGWVAPAWPVEHGGMGLSPSQLLIYFEEQERWGIGRAPDMGIQMVGPLLIKHGTPEQQAQYLPPILAGEHIWCQGYSEPNAGSDLASLRTEARQDGDEFVLNGQKTWTTLAQDATHMFCLARTSNEGKQQEGISFFLIDFASPGIDVRPIKNIAGHEEFCEVFLDDVRVPATDLVGGLNQGWTIAKALLSFERIFLGSPKQSQYALQRLAEIGQATGRFDDPVFRDQFTRLKLDVQDLESTFKRFADVVRRGETLGPDVSMLKIWATETFARLSEMLVEIAGESGAMTGKLPFGDIEVDVLTQFYNARPATIYAGSNEIQRNILAKHVLGLPDP